MGFRDILVLMVAYGAVPVALVQPWLGVIAWTWLGLMNPHKLAWNLDRFPIAEGVAGATLLGLLFTRDRRPVPLCLQTLLVAVLALYFTLTTALSWYPDVSWPRWSIVMKIFLFTFVITMLIHGRPRVRLLMLTAVFSLGFYGVKGGIFALVTGGQYHVWGPDDTFIGDNTALGLALCMVLPLALMSAREESNRWLRFALYSVFWLSIPAILFTYSRGAFLGLLAVMAALFWRYKGRLALLALVAGAGVYAASEFVPQQWYERQESTLNYQADRSAMQRIQAWGVATNIALDRPLLGAGFNFEYEGDNERWLGYAEFTGPHYSQARAAHSIYFQVLGQHGIVAFLLFMGLLLGTFWKLRRLGHLEHAPETAWIGRYAKAAQIAMVPYMVAGAFLSLAYFDLFYTLIAFSVVLEREHAAASFRAVTESHPGPLPAVTGGAWAERDGAEVRSGSGG